jgi:hypothetical protein
MKDQRLELNRYISNPFDNKGRIASQLNFRELFRNKYDTETGGSPWAPSRYTSEDLLKSIQNRKVTLNPRLNFVPNSPFWDTDNQLPPEQYEMFAGLGRFKRSDYDFENGRALTKTRPQEQPDFKDEWVEAYKLSPTVNPGKRAKNPMPRMANPDPNGFIMSMAENRAENEFEGNVSVAQLLADKKLNSTEERKGNQVISKEEENISPGKTIT